MSELFPRLAFPDPRLAVQVDDHTLDYRTLAVRAGGHAEHLAELGVAPGDRVGVFTDASLETVVALVGNALFGAVSVPLAPKLGSRELAHILGDARPAVVFGDAPHAEKVDGLRSVDARAGTPPRRGTEGPLLVLYTSGTTGAPKGASIRASGVAANLDALADAWGWTDADTVVHALPLFHVHGLVLGLFGSLRVGGALRTFSRFDPGVVAGALQRGRTMLFGVPTMFHRLADSAETDPSIAAGLRAARLLVSGSAGLPVREHRRIEALTGRGVLERYGLTESLIVCGVRADGPPRPGTVGPPLRDVELRLVDEARRPIEDGAIGEVAMRGPSLFEGYLGRDDATAEVVDPGGWFYTGDLATREADGSIRIVGRRSVDLIKTGGYKVGAGEVEACLLEAEGVAEVAVVGVPDDDLGQRIEAFVVLRAGVTLDADELADAVARELTPHKRPRAVHFVDALPRNAMGKVQKKRLLSDAGA